MKTAKIKHYAKALVEECKEGGCFPELVRDLKDADEKINGSMDFKRILTGKHISFAKKKDALKKVFGDFLGDKTYNFLFLLISDSKLEYLSSILEIAEKFNMDRSDVAEVIIETVIPIDAEEERKIEALIAKNKKQKLLLKNIINQSLIGGLRIKIGDEEIDGSIYGKINRLKRKIESFE